MFKVGDCVTIKQDDGDSNGYRQFAGLRATVTSIDANTVEDKPVVSALILPQGSKYDNLEISCYAWRLELVHETPQSAIIIGKWLSA